MKQAGRRSLALLLSAAMLLSLTGMAPVDGGGDAADPISQEEEVYTEPIAPQEPAIEEPGLEEPEVSPVEEPEVSSVEDPELPLAADPNVSEDTDGEKDADAPDEDAPEDVPYMATFQSLDAPVPILNVSVTLVDWDDGAKDMADRSVEVEDGSPLPQANDRAGWTFVGWYTAEVEHKFYGIEPGEFGTSVAADDINAFYTNVYLKDTRYQNYFKTFCGGDDSNRQAVYEAFYFRWSALTNGEKAETAQEGQTYYAMYRPAATYTIRWHHNGWNGLDGVLESSVQQDGYATAVVGAYKGATWGSRVFDGWYTLDGSEWESGLNGNAVVGTQPVTAGADYYARWHSTDPAVAGVHVSIVDNGFKTKVDCGQTVHVRAYFDPDGAAISGHFEWSCNDPTVGCTPTDTYANKRELAVTTPTEPTANLGRTTKSIVITATFVPDDPAAGSWSGSITLDLRHDFYKGQMLGTPNCKSSTQVLYLCPNCNYQYREKLAPFEHQVAVRSETSSCTTAGYTEEYCTRCNQVLSHTVQPALGHTWNVTTTAGCGGTVTTRTCTVCGTVETTGDANGAAHDWDEVPTVDKAPTCAADGSQSIHCRNCGATKDSAPIPADPELHVWGEWIVTQAATADEGGEEARACTVCGARETRQTLSGNEQQALDALKNADLTSSKQVEVALNAIVQDAGTTSSTLLASLNALAHSDDLEKQKLAASILLQDAIVTELNVRGLAGAELPADAGQFAAFFPDGTIAQYLDASVIVRTDKKLIGLISETAQPIAIGTALPGGGRIYQVIREHDGVYEPVPTWIAGDTLYFSSDKFSTFAVGSSDDIAYAVADPIPDQAFTGGPVFPGLRLTINGGTELTPGVDYDVAYENNAAPGLGKVTIAGKNGFTGTMVLYFNIVNAMSAESQSASDEDEYIVCEACGHHFWEPYLEGWRCTTCGHLRGTTGVPAAAAAAKRAYRGTIPQTADEFPLGGVVAVFGLSLAGLGALLMLRKKRR